MGDTIDNPNKLCCLKTAIVSNCDPETIKGIIIDSINEYQIQDEYFVLLISDAASYMHKAARFLKETFLNMFFTCKVHFIHKCAMKLKQKYVHVDKLIASIKCITVKNSTNSDLFAEIGEIQHVIVTRWSSWLEAPLF